MKLRLGLALICMLAPAAAWGMDNNNAESLHAQVPPANRSVYEQQAETYLPSSSPSSNRKIDESGSKTQNSLKEKGVDFFNTLKEYPNKYKKLLGNLWETKSYHSTSKNNVYKATAITSVIGLGALVYHVGYKGLRWIFGSKKWHHKAKLA